MAATAVDQKLLRQTKFPPEFNQKVDMQKVNVEVMKKWIAGKISEILGSEDDIVIELCFNLLEGSRYPDIKALQIQLTGFLDKDTAKFCKDLWNLCLSAQSNPQGVPKELLEAKKLELIQEKIEAEKAAEMSKQRKEQEGTRERDIETIRYRERNERAERGRGRGAYRGGRGFESRRLRDSHSPPPPRRARSPFRGPPPRRDADTWLPGGRGRPRNQVRGRSPSRSTSRSVSRSRSPPRRSRDELKRSSESPSRSPPRRRRRNSSSLSRSRSPPSRRHANGRPRSHHGRHAYSSSRSGSHSRSRSRSPRRRRNSTTRHNDRKRHKHGTNSISHRRRRSPSTSMSRSPSPERRVRNGDGRHRRGERSRSTPPLEAKHDKDTDILRDRISEDNRRLSRSPQHRPRRARGSSVSRSRSRSHSGDVPRKRRRSLQRWGSASRRRRNTSSQSRSSNDPKRRRRDSDQMSTSLANESAERKAIQGAVTTMRDD